MTKDKFIDFEGYRYKLAQDCEIPTDDPNLPSYESDDYKAFKSRLDFVSDFYEGDVKKYLPQFDRESDGSYQKRLNRTLYHNYFKPSVSGFPGFLSDIRSTEDLHQSIQENLSNVDLLGNDLKSFLWQADLKVIKDGYCGILTDMPKCPMDEEGKNVIKTYADQKSNPRLRPYWVLIDRRNIINFSMCCDGLETAVIREFTNQKVGRFGSESVTRFRTFDDEGNYTVEVIIEMGETQKEFKSLLIDEGTIAINQMPLTIYSCTDISPLDCSPPLENIAIKNKAYYELYSEYRNVMFMMGSPVPVRVGLVTPGQTDFNNIPDMVFGNTGMDLPMGGSFTFEEITGKVLETDRVELDKIETSIHLDSLRFLSGESGNRTATEVNLESVQITSTLRGMVSLKESMVEVIAEKWVNFMGETEGGKITINSDLLSIPLTSQDMAVLSSMATADQLSVITLLELMYEGKRLPLTVNPSREVQRIAAQVKLKQKQLKESNSNASPDTKDPSSNRTRLHDNQR